MKAARTALPLICNATKDSGQLFITGYSQEVRGNGKHRAMQTAGMKVTASVPMSGRYALAPLSMQYFTVRSMAVRRYRPRFLLTADQADYGNI